MTSRLHAIDPSSQLIQPLENYKIWRSLLKEFGLTLSPSDYKQHYLGTDVKRQVITAITQFYLAINPKILASIYHYNTAQHYRNQAKKRAHFFK